MHGWHGDAKHGGHPDDVKTVEDAGWFVIEPDMRGRGDSTGKPDANGWELQDAVDAVLFAQREYASSVATPESVYLTGGSGGGGNVLGLLGKFPDFFCTAVCEAGLSDYGLWYEHDAVGEFRDELEGKGWIGGSPATNAEAYASRGGLTTVENLLTPLAMTHGELDTRCPVEQARRYIDKARLLGKSRLIDYFEMKGVAATGGHFGGITAEQEARRRALVDRQLAPPRKPLLVPSCGRMAVAGYLRTKAFTVDFDSADRVGAIDYDLGNNRFKITARSARDAVLRIRRPDGTWQTSRIDISRSGQDIAGR